MKQSTNDIALNTLLQQLAIAQPSPEQVIKPAWSGLEQLSVTVKRDDLLHAIISGNKWRKLQHSLLTAMQHNLVHIVSFGGGFSNHLHALGYCCHILNIKFTAIIRGDYSANPSPMLKDLLRWKTDIQFVTKSNYLQRDEPDYLRQLQSQFGKVMIIPEGGSNELALNGIAELVHELNQSYDYIIAPVASGGTLAGLITATRNIPCKILGIGVLKGEAYLAELVQNLLPSDLQTLPSVHWSINHDYHFGGYAKSSQELKDFCADFYQQTQIAIEPIYSGKLFFALRELIGQKYFPLGSKILALHTGGLQGTRT